MEMIIVMVKKVIKKRNFSNPIIKNYGVKRMSVFIS